MTTTYSTEYTGAWTWSITLFAGIFFFYLKREISPVAKVKSLLWIALSIMECVRAYFGPMIFFAQLPVTVEH